MGKVTVIVRFTMKFYATAEQMQEDIRRRRERGYQVSGNPFFGPPVAKTLSYLHVVGLRGLFKAVPVWQVVYEKTRRVPS